MTAEYVPAVTRRDAALWLDGNDDLRWVAPDVTPPESWRRLYVRAEPAAEPEPPAEATQ